MHLKRSDHYGQGVSMGSGHFRGRKRSSSVGIGKRTVSIEPNPGCWRPTCASLSRQ
jgi:hypothetical protein